MIDYLFYNLFFKVDALDPTIKTIKKIADNYLIICKFYFVF